MKQNLGFYAVKFQLFKINKLFSKDAKKTYKNVLKRENCVNFLPNFIDIVKRKN